MISNCRMVLTDMEYGKKKFQLLLVLDSNNHPIELHCNPIENPSLVGNIYVARVEQVHQQMNAAFLKCNHLIFYYPLVSMDRILFTKKTGSATQLCQGDELVVQVVRDAIKTKEICVTTNISFAGEHVVLTTGNEIHGISKKITGEKRAELKKLLEQDTLSKQGFVIRTSAKDCSLDEIRDEVRALEKEYESFWNKVKHLSCHQLVKKADHPFMAHIKRWMSSCDEILTDQKEWLDTLRDISLHCFLREYQDASYSIQKLFGISTLLDKLLHPRVYLPSGGYLIIEPTEALTVIDVNSGKNVKRTTSEKYYYQNNVEAAKIIARELRLRNISGMILIDFINMKDKEYKDALLQICKEEMKEDFAKVSVLGYTRLGLVEITRAKKQPSIKEILST